MACGVVLIILGAAQSPVWFVIAVPVLIWGFVTFSRAPAAPPSSAEVAKTRDEKWNEYEQVHTAWSEEVVKEEAESQRLFQAAPRWYPIDRLDSTRRLDVFGGNAEGWASFLNTAFASITSEPTTVTVLDLTRRDLVRRALWPNGGSAAATLFLALPSQIRTYDPLVGARHPAEIVALITSSQGGQDDWARRDVETGLLHRLTDALGGNVTFPRLLAGVTSLMAPDAPIVAEQLTPEERRPLQDPNFVVMLGADASAHLSRLVAALEAFVRASPTDSSESTDVQALPLFAQGRTTIVAAEDYGDAEFRRRLDNVLVGSLVDRLQGPTGRGLLLVAGGDRLSRANLEGLADRAEERGLQLAIFFEYLRGEARDLVGRRGADTILMSLGNHEDATAAANFIGKEQRFRISSITRTVGTSFGGSDTHGFSVTDSDSYTRQHMAHDSATTGRSVGTSFNYGRTWSETDNYGETSTLSEEFLARAEDIQRIPTTGFIYVTAVDAKKHVIFGDCHPAIAHTQLVAARPIARR
jgi:hypothetical protein